MTLDHLPPLRDDTYDPETFARLGVHLRTAREAAVTRWAEQLDGALTRWHSTHELARDLIQLRSGLARFVQLSNHPSLPPAWLKIFSEDAARSVARLQRELEENVEKSLRRGAWSRTQHDEILRTVRDNSLLGTLQVTVSQTGERQALAPLPEVSPRGGEPVPTRRRRLVDL